MIKLSILNLKMEKDQWLTSDMISNQNWQKTHILLPKKRVLADLVKLNQETMTNSTQNVTGQWLGLCKTCHLNLGRTEVQPNIQFNVFTESKKSTTKLKTPSPLIQAKLSSTKSLDITMSRLKRLLEKLQKIQLTDQPRVKPKSQKTINL